MKKQETVSHYFNKYQGTSDETYLRANSFTRPTDHYLDNLPLQATSYLFNFSLEKFITLLYSFGRR